MISGLTDEQDNSSMLNQLTEDVTKLYLLRGVISLSIVAFLRENDVEHGVRAAACLIHVGGSHSPADTEITFIISSFSKSSVCSADLQRG